MSFGTGEILAEQSGLSVVRDRAFDFTDDVRMQADREWKAIVETSVVAADLVLEHARAGLLDLLRQDSTQSANPLVAVEAYFDGAFSGRGTASNPPDFCLSLGSMELVLSPSRSLCSSD